MMGAPPVSLDDHFTVKAENVEWLILTVGALGATEVKYEIINILLQKSSLISYLIHLKKQINNTR